MTYNVFGGTLSLTQSINQSECCRDKGLIIKRYINSSVYFTLHDKHSRPVVDSLKRERILDVRIVLDLQDDP